MWSALRAFRITDAIDILLVAVVLYRVFVMFKETRAVQMLLGLGGLMVVSFAARRFDLFSTSYLLENFWSFWVLALVVLFQPELRRALARLGQSRLFQGVTVGVREQQGRLIDDVVKAADALAGKRIGALLVLERTTGLRNYAELGVHLDALVSSDLLESLFLPYSPLHDGAVFIRGDRVAAAGCFLPRALREIRPARGRAIRAALGLAEGRRGGARRLEESDGFRWRWAGTWNPARPRGAAPPAGELFSLGPRPTSRPSPGGCRWD
jgi:diadenylate cyclase